MNRFKQKLLSQSRIHPYWSGVGIFFVIMLGGLLVGMLTPGDGGITNIFDRAGIYAGWVSIAFAWAVGVHVWAKKKDAVLSFEGAGEEVATVGEAFDASLILASKYIQPEWHLRHINPKHVEFLWTSFTEDKTKALLKTFNNVNNEHGPDSGDAMELQDPYDMAEVTELTKKLLYLILAEGYKPERVCVDVTSGTGVMSIAAFQAAEMLGVTSIFLVGKTQNNGNPIIDSAKVCDADEAKVILLSDHRAPLSDAGSQEQEETE